MLTLATPLRVLDPLQRHRDRPADAVGHVLYAVRAGRLIEAETPHGPDRWTCRIVDCTGDPQCRTVLTGADLATALDLADLTGTGHPDPATHLVAYRAAWRSQAWHRCGSRAGAVADLLTGDVGRDLTVDLDSPHTRVRAQQVHMLPVGFKQVLVRLTTAGLLHPVDDGGGHQRAVLTLPPRPALVLA
ncbi:hypothetical protein [Dactylosporangium sp. NPDC048998]|uniref:hypothetical protein n=1 Tax=Dactylosporangium sp. NPDC048998 TaxID=3363976 RepID=UPI003721EDBB